MERFLKSRYKVEEKLGENPFSITYKGSYLGSHKPVTVKIYKRGTLNNFLIKAMKEKVKVLLSFSHPSIARLIDGDYGWQGFYYIREYVEGKSIRDLLKENHIFTVDDALNIGIEVCKALKVCHENGIVHGALNPNNIFIDSQGIVKVTDFVVEGEIKESVEQKAEFIQEGAPYLSPEEVSGSQASFMSDIYSLGLVLFEMMAGKYPFSNGTKITGLELALKKLKSTPPTLTKWNPNVPKPVEEIIARSLNPDPLLRFPSIDDFSSSLNNRSTIINVPSFDFPAFNYESLVGEPEKKEVYSRVISVQEKKEFKKLWNWVLQALVVAVLGGLAFAAVQSWLR
jgi:serine/threonine-protein kinase